MKHHLTFLLLLKGKGETELDFFIKKTKFSTSPMQKEIQAHFQHAQKRFQHLFLCFPCIIQQKAINDFHISLEAKFVSLF